MKRLLELFKKERFGIMCSHYYAHTESRQTHQLPGSLKGIDRTIYEVCESLGLNPTVLPVLVNDDIWQNDERNTNPHSHLPLVGKKLAPYAEFDHDLENGYSESDLPNNFKREEVKWLSVTPMNTPEDKHGLAMMSIGYGNEPYLDGWYTAAAVFFGRDRERKEYQPRYEPPQYQQPQQQGPIEGFESGNYQGLSYTIKHRNTSSILNVSLNQGDQIKSLPGAMVHMSPTVQLQGKINVSLKKLFTGAQLDESTYTGPGTVALAPILMGDIITLQVQPGKTWQVGRRWYLARTMGVEMDTHAQRFGQALFSGDGLFTYHMTGSGLLWLYAYGALDTLHVSLTSSAFVNRQFVVYVRWL